MKKESLSVVLTVLLSITLLQVSAGEGTPGDKTAHLKKRLENIDKQYADKERLQKESENDPCLAAALKKREDSISRMKTHINDMIAAIEAGGETKVDELRNKEKELGRELDLSNRAIFFAKQAAAHRRSAAEIGKKLSEKGENTLPEDQEMQKTLQDLAATFEGLAANPPEDYKEDGTVITARKRLDELEVMRSRKIIEQEFNSSVERIKKQMDENAGDPEIKEAGEKLINIHSQIKELKITATDARARERAMMSDKYAAESDFQGKIKNARKTAEEKKMKEKKEAKETTPAAE